MPLTQIGINGFGPLGRQVFKFLWTHYPELQIGAIGMSDSEKAEVCNLLMERGSIPGKFFHGHKVYLDPNRNILSIDGQNISIIPRLEPERAMQWANHHIDVVIDTTQGCQQYSKLTLLKLDKRKPAYAHSNLMGPDPEQLETPLSLLTLQGFVSSALISLCQMD